MAAPAPEWSLGDLAIVAPEFAAIAQGTFDFWAAAASAQIVRSRFGQRTALAGCYLTAHLLSLSPPAGVMPSANTTAPLSSEGVGGAGTVTATYAIKQFGPSSLHLTRYGIEFARLARYAGMGGVVP